MSGISHWKSCRVSVKHFDRCRAGYDGAVDPLLVVCPCWLFLLGGRMSVAVVFCWSSVTFLKFLSNSSKYFSLKSLNDEEESTFIGWPSRSKSLYPHFRVLLLDLLLRWFDRSWQFKEQRIRKMQSEIASSHFVPRCRQVDTSTRNTACVSQELPDMMVYPLYVWWSCESLKRHCDILLPLSG